MSERMSSFDVMKAIAAFLVVYIHIPISGTIGSMLVPVTRVAVSFFFMVSGYFIWNSDSAILRGKIKKQMKYVLFLTIFSHLLFFAWGILTNFLFGESVQDYLKAVFSLERIVRFLVLNASPVSAHLWYLSSYLYVLVIYYFICKFDRSNAVYLLIPVLLIGDLALGKYSMVIFGRDLPNELARNFLFVGLPYFLLGILLKKEAGRVINLGHKNGFLAGYFLFSATSIAEKYILMSNHVNATRDHYISTTLAVTCAFIYAMQNPGLLQGSLLEKIGRNDSLTIYIIHPVFIVILSVMMKHLGVSKVYGYVAPLLVFAVSVGFAMVWNSFCKPLLNGKFTKRLAFVKKSEP